jgi:alpha-methylacyl-CoA racemase
MRHRGTFVDFHGVVQPAPAPRFDRTAPELSRPPSFEGQHTDEVLADFGFSDDRIRALRDAKAIA